MPRSSSWRHRVSQIQTALRTLDCEQLQRAQIEPLFGLQRRAALRLMAPLVSASRNGSWQVDRQRLIQWLEGFEQEASEEEKRHRLVLQAHYRGINKRPITHIMYSEATITSPCIPTTSNPHFPCND